jgi:hypothetical protein
VTSVALLMPAEELVVEALDRVLEGLVEALYEVLPFDGVDVVLHPEPSTGLEIPNPFVSPDRLPDIQGVEVQNEVGGIRDVPLVGDPEAKELPLEGVEGDLDPCLLSFHPCVSWPHLSGWNARSPSSHGISLTERRNCEATGVLLCGSSFGLAQESLTSSLN